MNQNFIIEKTKAYFLALILNILKKYCFIKLYECSVIDYFLKGQFVTYNVSNVKTVQFYLRKSITIN